MSTFQFIILLLLDFYYKTKQWNLILLRDIMSRYRMTDMYMQFM